MVIHSRIQDPCEGELCNNSYCRKPLNIVEKLSILDVCRSLGYASVLFPAPTKERIDESLFFTNILAVDIVFNETPLRYCYPTRGINNYC